MVTNKNLKSLKLFFLFTGLLIVGACKQSTFESKEELISHIMNPENGLVQTKKVNGVEYSITLRPTDLMAYQEIDGRNDEKEFELLRKKYKDFIYLNMSISNQGKEVLSTNFKNRTDYAKNVKQMVFNMGSKIHLLTKSKDTIPLLDYIFPRTYGMSHSSTMMLVFNRDSQIFKEDYCFLTIEDFGLNTGDVSFKIATKNVLNEPKLRFN
jgi:hypothetical protein